MLVVLNSDAKTWTGYLGGTKEIRDYLIGEGKDLPESLKLRLIDKGSFLFKGLDVYEKYKVNNPEN